MSERAHDLAWWAAIAGVFGALAVLAGGGFLLAGQPDEAIRAVGYIGIAFLCYSFVALCMIGAMNLAYWFADRKRSR